jgi:hypothetical protein
MPGPGTGPRPGGWETLLYSVRWFYSFPQFVCVCVCVTLYHANNVAIEKWDTLLFFSEFTKLQKATSFDMSVSLSFFFFFCANRTSQLPVVGFSSILVFEYFWKICWENSSFIEICQEYLVLHLKTNSHLWQYLACLFLEWETFRTKFVSKIKTNILCSVNLFSKSHAVYDTGCSTRYRTRHWRYCNEIWTGVLSLCEKWKGMCL